MKDIENIQFNNNESTSKIVAEKATLTIYKNEKSYYNNGGFFTSFSDTFIEIAKNKNLNKLDYKLLILLLGYMGDKEVMIRPNTQHLFRLKYYAEDLNTKQPHIVRSFQKLEEMGYIKRNKQRKELIILINPAMAYNGKAKDFTKIWNQLSIPFGNPARKVENVETGHQDWNSHLLNDLETNQDY